MATTDRGSGGPLLERAAELRAIGATVDSLLGEGRGGVVAIEGPAGIGKTALLAELAAVVEAGGGRAARARATPLEREFGFGVVLDLLSEPVWKAGADASFAGAAGFARGLFEQGPPDAARGGEFALIHGIHWLCANLAEAAPLALCLDDAQWGDEMSLRALAYVAARAVELPLLVAVTVRSGEPVGDAPALAELSGAAGVAVLRPATLSASAVGEMAARELGEITAEQRQTCWRRSGGNPFFVREILRAARASGGVEVGDEVPGGVARLVERRVESLPGNARAVAAALAVLGDSVQLGALQAATGLETDAALTGLDRLAAAELTVPDHPYAYLHPILRDAVAATVPAGEATALRLRAAAAMRVADPARAASYLLEAQPRGPGPEPWAGDLLLSAAAAARARGGATEATAYLRRACEEELGTPRRRAALLELGELEASAGDPAAIEHLADAAALSEDPVERARIALARGEALFHFVALEQCATVCRAASGELPEAERELRLALEATALNADALRGVERGRPAELAADVIEGRTAGERAVLIHIVADLAAAGSAPAAEVCELGRRALAGGALLREVGPASPIYIYAGTALAWAGAYRDVLELTTAGMEEGRRAGSVIAISYSAALRSGTALLAGDLALAEADAELVVAELPAPDPMAYAVAAGWLVETLVERGRAKEARAVLERSGLTGELPELGTIDFLLLARGALAEAEGDPEAALAEYREVGRRVTRARYTNPSAMGWRSRAALVLAELGQGEEGLELAAEELRLAAAFGAPRAHGIALRVHGDLTGGESGLEQLRESAALLAGASAVEHARSLLALGRALHAGGGDGARAALSEAMDRAHRAGAHRLVEEAMAALRQTGARPRRPRISGAAALTPQERRVARLAAEGETNRAIAEALFLTQRTVEMHLTNAYQKLEIASRGELSAALGDSLFVPPAVPPRFAADRIWLCSASEGCRSG